MCGITGFYSLKKRLNRDLLQNMADSLSHRGPDSEGYFQDEVVSLGAKRLRIVDCTIESDQPIHSINGKYIMVFTGEIYNFREIAMQLPSLVNASAPLSDSRVLIEAFSHWGLSFLQRLNGMFAMVIYDKSEQTLFIFKDRIGIKPLYYYWEGGNFAFASEIKALLQLPWINKEINYSSIPQFLHLGMVPSSNTMYSHIKKLTPGTYLKINNNQFSQEKYWTIEKCINDTVISNEEEAKYKLDSLIKSSVSYQFSNEVSTAVLLSGGIDSTLLTANAATISNAKINTYTIGFTDDDSNELKHSRNIAHVLNTNHNECIVTHRDALPLIDKLLNTFDEPIANSSAIPLHLLNQYVKPNVILLSGEGADELFHGYGNYRWANQLAQSHIQILRPLLSKIFPLLNSRHKRIAALLNFNSHTPLPKHIFSQEQYYFSQEEISHTFFTARIQNEYATTNSMSFDLDIPIFLNRKLSPAEYQALCDLKYYLPYDLLTQADLVSMSHSIETRVPYLDHRIIEFALNLSPSLKTKSNISKYILREVLYKYIPKKLVHRPKQGLAIPLAKWLRNEWKHIIDDTLSKKNIKKANVVEFNKVSRLIHNFKNGDDYLFNRIWLLISLHKWLAKNS